MRPLSITWLGHATFVLESPGGKRLIFDPFVTGNPSAPDDAKKAIGALDLMLVTHGHSDHTGDAVPLGRSTGAHVIAPHELSVWLQKKGLKNVTGMNPGGTLRMLGLSITMVPAQHSSSVEEDGQVIYMGVATGYVVTFENGQTIYYAGDTSIFGDMRLIGEMYHPQIAFLPIGDHYDGPGAGRESVRSAWCEAGGADALRNVPRADRHARETPRTRRTARRAGA